MRLPHLLAGVCLLANAGPLLVHAADPSSAVPQPVDALREVATEWAKVRSEGVRIQSNWEWERTLLNSTLTALQDRARTLEDQRTALEAKTSGDRDTITKLTARNATADAALAAANDRLKQAAAELVRLRPWLPPRLSQALELPFRSLASDTLTPGERMQYITTVLNRSAQFNKAITYGEELLSPAGEADRRLLEVVYWGLGQAYALDRARHLAYLGLPGPDGWVWEPQPDAADAVDRLTAIYRDKADPAFVEVPARVVALESSTAKTAP